MTGANINRLSDMKFPVTDSAYRIEIASKSQLPKMLECLHKNFYYEETLFRSLYLNTKNYIREEDCLIVTDLDRLTKSVFEHSPSLVAIHNDSGEIVAVHITALLEKPISEKSSTGNPTFTKNPTRSKIVKTYFEFFRDVPNINKLFSNFPEAEMALEFYAVAIDSNHRRKNLSKDLINAGVLLAKSIPTVGFVYGVFTSTYSKKSSVKLGMRSIQDIDILTHKDPEYGYIFRNTEPHNKISVMVMAIR
ncbi:uncharacterized protein [Prorops nasuta]|uniref:uncharacterized protein n=1 Tax=Prorops nasuta TaxID=863751 RepID=UPI0034CDB5FC